MRIGIVAGEISGDKLGAGLINEIKRRHPEAEFVGIGGPDMIAAGCDSLYPLEKLSVMGLVEVLKQFRELRQIRNHLVEYFTAHPPDVFIGIDYKEFNLSTARQLKVQGIKTVQYVSPQVWAWRPWRVKKIAQSVDLILCVLPFEERYFQAQSVLAKFVGHPLADSIPDQVDQTNARKLLGLTNEKRVIALLPGSRSKEWQFHMLRFIETAQWCAQQRPDLEFVIALVNERAAENFQRTMDDMTKKPLINPVIGQAQTVIASADVVLTVSGTATLEIMLLKRPMVVAYRMAWLTYQIAKRLVKLPYISLPNILAEEMTAPEFIQDQATPEQLGQALIDWLENDERRDKTMQTYQRIHTQMRQEADQLAADAVLKLCHD